MLQGHAGADPQSVKQEEDHLLAAGMSEACDRCMP